MNGMKCLTPWWAQGKKGKTLGGEVLTQSRPNWHDQETMGGAKGMETNQFKTAETQEWCGLDINREATAAPVLRRFDFGVFIRF